MDDGRPSNKLSRATAYGIPIVSERRFLEWTGKAVPDGIQKTYSADQLAALSKMSMAMIYELARLSLLDERDGRFGFRDLASARQIAKLLNDGVRLSEIIRAGASLFSFLAAQQREERAAGVGRPFSHPRYAQWPEVQ